MALDLLYVISDSSNVTKVVKDLLNILLVATDEEFIEELSLKVFIFFKDRFVWLLRSIHKTVVGTSIPFSKYSF